MIAVSTVAPSDLLAPGESVAGRAGGTSGLLTANWRRSDEADIASDTMDPNPASKSRDTLHLRLEQETGAGPFGLTVTGDRLGARTDIDSLELSGGRFQALCFSH